MSVRLQPLSHFGSLPVIHRRELLRRSALLSLSPVIPGFLARTAAAAEAGRDTRVLVVIQLDGGNDGINTVVPFGDEAYGKLRRELRLPTDNLCKVADGVGLNPSMRRAADLLEDRPAGDRAGGRLSQPESLALREHGDLANRPPGPPRS